MELNVQQTIIRKKTNIGGNTIGQVVKVVKRSYFIVLWFSCFCFFVLFNVLSFLYSYIARNLIKKTMYRHKPHLIIKCSCFFCSKSGILRYSVEVQHLNTNVDLLINPRGLLVLVVHCGPDPAEDLISNLCEYLQVLNSSYIGYILVSTY